MQASEDGAEIDGHLHTQTIVNAKPVAMFAFCRPTLIS
jgi:hypothetical protein